MRGRSVAWRALAAIAALAGAGAALGLGGVGAAGAAGSARAPIPIRSAALAQRGLELRLSVTLAHRFSPTGLAHAGNTLCLIFGPSAAGRLCLAPPRGRRRAPRLLLITAGGSAHAIAAKVSRPSASSLVASFTPRAIGRRYRSFRWQLQSALTPAACQAGTQTSTTVTPPSCPPAVYPARPALARLHTPRLVGCAPSGRSLVFGGPSAGREIALSFDDGPWQDPPSIDFVRLLARYHVPATFFEIGDQIGTYDRNGAVERLMLEDGDMIGDHTWTHPDMLNLSAAQQSSQLELTAQAIHHATGFTPCLWRPPYGSTDGSLEALARRLGMLTIMWNIDPRDWSLPGTAAIERSVIDNAMPGGIVEMHFGGGPRYETYDALPDIITTLRRRGYRFVNIAQLLRLRLIYR